MIAASEQTLDLQDFVWAADDTGQRVLQELLRAADRCVRVRLLLDDLYAGEAEAPAATSFARRRSEQIARRGWCRGFHHRTPGDPMKLVDRLSLPLACVAFLALSHAQAQVSREEVKAQARAANKAGETGRNRSDVKAETRGAVKSGKIPHGEQ